MDFQLVTSYKPRGDQPQAISIVFAQKNENLLLPPRVGF
jgi:excinuclease UvrABC helicase subunit UvrB